MSKSPFDDLRQINLDFRAPSFVKAGQVFDAAAMFDTQHSSEFNGMCFSAHMQLRIARMQAHRSDPARCFDVEKDRQAVS